MPSVPAKYLPTVFVTGRPSKIEAETTTFEIDAHQWVRFAKDQERPVFPFTGSYPKDRAPGRPFPNPNVPKFVQAVGFLTGTLMDGDRKRFMVELQGVTFLGTAPPPATSKSM